MLRGALQLGRRRRADGDHPVGDRPALLRRVGHGDRRHRAVLVAEQVGDRAGLRVLALRETVHALSEQQVCHRVEILGEPTTDAPQLPPLRLVDAVDQGVDLRSQRVLGLRPPGGIDPGQQVSIGQVSLRRRQVLGAVGQIAKFVDVAIQRAIGVMYIAFEPGAENIGEVLSVAHPI